MTIVTDDRVVVLMQTPGWGDECYVCGEPASGFHGLPIFNGDVMSNDWPGEWAGVPACLRCYEKHERGEMETWDAVYRHHLHAVGLLDGAGI